MVEGVDADSRAGLVEPERVRVWEDAFHVLHLRVDEREYADVRPARAFPLSGRADFVTFLSLEGKEVALVANPDRLDAASRAALEAALARMYYVPKILRIDGMVETWGVSRWSVLTDRGYATFEVVDRDHIRKLPDGRFIIQDADGNRFEIENLGRLDAKSQSLLASET